MFAHAQRHCRPQSRGDLNLVNTGNLLLFSVLCGIVRMACIFQNTFIHSYVVGMEVSDSGFVKIV